MFVKLVIPNRMSLNGSWSEWECQSKENDRVLLLAITGGRHQHSLSLRDRSIWLKWATVNIVKINQEYRQLEADGKFDQKRSEEKEGMMMLLCAFCFHFPFCSSARVEISRKESILLLSQASWINNKWKWSRNGSVPLVKISLKSAVHQQRQKISETANCPPREKVRVPQNYSLRI